jgi:hypothetical protein
MMLESGHIRLVRPPAVIIAPGQTLEDCFHKDCPRNVGCVHHTVELTGTKLAHQARAAVVRGIS